MKHRILTALMTATLTVCAMPAMADTAIGYTNGNITRGQNCYGFGSGTTQGVLIYIPAAKAAALKGHKIVGLRTSFASRQYSNLYLYVTKNMTGAPLSRQALSGTNSTSALATFTATDAVELDGEAFYVGMTFTCSDASKKDLIYFDAASDFAQDSLFWAVGDNGWQDVTHQGIGAPVLQMLLEGDVSMTDVIVKSAAAQDASGANFLQAGEPINVTAEIHNFGTTTITGYDIICQVGDEETRFGYTDVSIAPNQSATVSIDNYVTQNGGDLPLQVRVENLSNSGSITEADLSDNEAASSAYVYPLSCDKKVLLEIYTGAYCVNCPTGHTYLEQVMSGNEDKFVLANHHSYVSSNTVDIYSIYESILFSYWLGATSFPSASYNRMAVSATDDCVAYAATDIAADRAGVAASLKTEPYVSIALSNTYHTNTLSGTLTATIHTYNLPAQTSGHYRINAWIAQDSIVGYQNGGSNNYMHMEVLRKFLTDTYGDEIALTKGEDTEVTFDYEIPAEGFESTGLTYYTGTKYCIANDFSNMHFIVSVGEVSDSNVNVPIYNAATINLLDGATGIEAVASDCHEGAACYDLQGRQIAAPVKGQPYVSDGHIKVIR